jgi:hypothetical protein
LYNWGDLSAGSAGEPSRDVVRQVFYVGHGLLSCTFGQGKG